MRRVSDRVASAIFTSVAHVSAQTALGGEREARRLRKLGAKSGIAQRTDFRPLSDDVDQR
jgi:hypothetical protein